MEILRPDVILIDIFLGAESGLSLARAALSLGVAVASVLAAASIAPNCDAPDFLQGLLLLILPPVAATGAGCATWYSFAGRSVARTATTLLVTVACALGVWFLVLVLWVGNCSS